MQYLLELLKESEAQSFLFMNESFRHPVVDFIMWWASSRFIWIPLYIFFLWRIITAYPKFFLLLVVSCTLLILLNDQMGNVFKHGFERLRPTHDGDLGPYVNIVNDYRGGRYGFYSAHAANTFALAMFVVLLCRKEYKFMMPIAFGYATLVSFSRIYLGVHYPSDVVTGAVIGLFFGWLFAHLYVKTYEWSFNRKFVLQEAQQQQQQAG